MPELQKPPLILTFQQIMDYYDGKIPSPPTGYYWRLQFDRQVMVAVKEGS